MLNPGGGYLAAQNAKGNHVTQKCVIEIGNMALASQGAVASASSTFSAAWPAAGVLDGDLTHINAGAAAVADNGVGGSTWQGNVLAGGGGVLATPEVLTIDMGVRRKVSRVKLIFWPSNTLSNNLGAIAPADFLIEYLATDVGANRYNEGGYDEGTYDGTDVWTPWSGLTDKGAEIGKAATAIAAGQVTGNVNDMVVFEDPDAKTFQQFRFTFTKLQSAGIRTRVIAVEITWAVDVSAFVKSARRSRAKDFHLQRRTAAALDVTLVNRDQRFNDQHVVTDADRANGYFSDFIRPHLPVRYFAGFSGTNVQMFSGTIESWTGDSRRKNVDTAALDFLKSLVQPQITTNLKTNQLIEALIEYVANKQNFPSNMMVLDSTTLVEPYFFPQAQSIQKVLNDLQDATGDAEIFVDEVGRLTYRNYNTSVSHQYLVQTQAFWQAGTLANIDALSQPNSILREWFLLDDWADHQFTTNPVWTLVFGTADASTGRLVLGGPTFLSTPFAKNTGAWASRIQLSSANGAMYISSSVNPLSSGAYYVRLDTAGGGTLYLIRNDPGPITTILASVAGVGTGPLEIRLTRDGSGNLQVFVDRVLKLSATDNTYTTFTQFTLGCISGTNVFFDYAYWGGAVDGASLVSNVQATSDSPVQDFGATVQSLGAVQAIFSAPAGTSVTIYTRSGPTLVPDGSWSAFAVVAPGANFAGPLNRYGQIRLVLGCPIDDGLHNANTATPQVSFLSANYKDAAGTARNTGTPDWSATDQGLLLASNRSLSSLVNGNNFIFTQAVVKAKPLILSPNSTTAWQGTNNGAAISAANPFWLPVGTTVLNVTLNAPGFGVPQTVNITLGTAVATTSLSSHPTNPVLTITVTTAGSVTALTISGFAFVNNTVIQASAEASLFVKQNYDPNVDELDNDFITNLPLAQDIASQRMARFGQGALDYVKEGAVRFFPGAQINDLVNVVDSFAELNKNYYLLGAVDELAQTDGKGFTARTTAELIKIA